MSTTISKEIQDTLREYFKAPSGPLTTSRAIPTFELTPPTTPAPSNHPHSPSWMFPSNMEHQRRMSMPALQFQRRASVIFPRSVSSAGSMSDFHFPPAPSAPPLPKATFDPSILFEQQCASIHEDMEFPCPPAAEVNSISGLTISVPLSTPATKS
jgi:hypothetical protein